MVVVVAAEHAAREVTALKSQTAGDLEIAKRMDLKGSGQSRTRRIGWLQRLRHARLTTSFRRPGLHHGQSLKNMPGPGSPANFVRLGELGPAAHPYELHQFALRCFLNQAADWLAYSGRGRWSPS